MREREREREGGRQRETETEGERQRETERGDRVQVTFPSWQHFTAKFGVFSVIC